LEPFLPLALDARACLDSAHRALDPTVMSIRHWPGAERPREKLLERGAHALSDAELLALLLGSGIRGHSAVELARTLIAQFGSLRMLLNAEAERCFAQAGIGPARYAVLKAALELARRHFREALRVGPTLGAADVTRTFLVAQLRDRPYEVFCCSAARSTVPGCIPGRCCARLWRTMPRRLFSRITIHREFSSPARRTSSSRGASRRHWH
jgi:uncharacterized protein UPF0758